MLICAFLICHMLMKSIEKKFCQFTFFTCSLKHDYVPLFKQSVCVCAIFKTLRYKVRESHLFLAHFVWRHTYSSRVSRDIKKGWIFSVIWCILCCRFPSISKLHIRKALQTVLLTWLCYLCIFFLNLYTFYWQILYILVIGWCQFSF